MELEVQIYKPKYLKFECLKYKHNETRHMAHVHQEHCKKIVLKPQRKG